MWIKSKHGLFNTDHIERFEECGQSTIAFFGSSTTPKIISHSCVLNDILNALRNGVPYLEVV